MVINNGNAIAQGRVADLLSYEDLLVDIEVDEINKAVSLIANSEWQQYFKEQNHEYLRFNLPKEQVPFLNKFFIANGVGLVSSTYRKRLEDYFLRITKDN